MSNPGRGTPSPTVLRSARSSGLDKILVKGDGWVRGYFVGCACVDSDFAALVSQSLLVCMRKSLACRWPVVGSPAKLHMYMMYIIAVTQVRHLRLYTSISGVTTAEGLLSKAAKDDDTCIVVYSRKR